MLPYPAERMPDLSEDQLVDLIVRRAPELRAAGVLNIQIGQLKVTLAPHQDEIAEKPDDDRSERVQAPIDLWTAPRRPGAASHIQVNQAAEDDDL